MNYVGQLAETVFVTVKELYRGLNPATLTGGIDVIVVRQPDGSLQCSPFHVRFGKLGVLRSKEKVVDIEINGEPVDLHMKLGNNGEAFFVEESESLEVGVPAHLCTSPIPMENLVVSEVAESPFNTTASSRRKKRRKKRTRSDAHLHEDDSSSSEERENPEQDVLKEESVFMASLFYSRPSSPKSDSELFVKPQETSGPQMQWNWGAFPKQVCPSERGSPPPLITPSECSHFRTIQRQASFNMESSDPLTTVTVLRPEPWIHETRVEHSTPNTDTSSPTDQASLLTPPLVEPAVGSEQRNTSELETLSGLSDCMSNIVSTCVTDCGTRTANRVNTDDFTGPSNSDRVVSVLNDVSKKPVISVCSEYHASTVSVLDTADTISMAQSEALASLVDKISAFTETGLQTTAEIGTSVERDSGIEALTVGFAQEEGKVAQKGKAIVAPHTNHEAKSGGVTEHVESVKLEKSSFFQSSNAAESSTKAAESQEKKNGKRSQHVGPADIYLDDLSKLDPEVVALYFPKSEGESPSQGDAELGSVPSIQSSQSGQQSPQTVSTANVDSGTEYLSDSTTDNLEVSLSLCGTEGYSRKIKKEKFEEHMVTYQDFVNNPGIIDDPNLVICINSNYYNWAAAAPMILSMQAFQKNLPTSTVEQLVKDKMPKKSGRWWFSWRRKDLENNQPNTKPDSEDHQVVASSSPTIPPTIKNHSAQLSSDDDGNESESVNRQESVTEAMSTAQCLNQIYRKSLRLTSQQIERLNLKEGANNIVFSVTTQYQGTCRCEAAIYLWNWDDKVIISDIDGTITKSDALGHILPQLGKDWTHQGIAKLYNKIHENGYKFLYCSARAIGMANITKGYLQWVNDKGIVLPKGPVLLAPSSLFSALHREVIEKKPEVFKIACLTDIRDLFSPHRHPFYAAFGNRTNDAFAYKKVGVPETRIFTVNPKGELMQENSKSHKSSYSHLSELVEHVFPLICKGRPASLDYPEFSNFSFWREPLAPLDLTSL
ncbi:zgc:123305 isoform X3 [Tachysurus fulvidraco]|uniref:zgc:123305 isoform X3 n=1 Tax=Tachysurus fulvidraco TaxID=1234273 RepID=UPI001FED4841|nr:zgc:123305 isoform X3 [Tachysurus fulvidraco]